MIIVGDIASPSEMYSDKLYDFFEENQNVFKSHTVVCNFEGLIDKDRPLKDRTPILFNHPSVFKALEKGNVKVAALANNHILDLPQNYKETNRLLKENQIQSVGAGETKQFSSDPVFFKENGVEIVLINACWDFLLYHQRNPSKGIHINTIKEFEILKQIKEIRKEHPLARIVTYFHWSFDLEVLPFPMYRQFSHALIDTGVSLVVGAHSHCVQGGELYNKGCIVYGLGNFFIPNGVYAGAKLKFPAWAAEELAIEWNLKTNEFICHWFKSEGLNTNFSLKYLESSEFLKCSKIDEYSAYTKLSNDDYVKYYKKNRRKKILTPVFTDFRKKIANTMKLTFLKLRAKFARTLAKMGLINWQN